MKHAWYLALTTMLAVGLLQSAPARATTDFLPRIGTVLRTGALREAGFDGQGVRVGVISEGAGNYATLARAAILPSHVALYGDEPGRGDEGDWMMQIVHDVAPRARLAFCPGGVPTRTVRCAATLIKRFHADIVVDDVNPQPVFFYPTAKTLGLAALRAHYPKVLFFTGAGNNNGGYYQGRWTPVPITVGGTAYEAQDFGHSLGRQSRAYDGFRLPPGMQAAVLLGINDRPPTDGACSTDNPRVTLALLDEAGRVLTERSSRCPVMSMAYRNDRFSAQSVRVAILLPPRTHAPQLSFKLAVIRAGEGVSPLALRYSTPGAAGNSATAAGLTAVAAVDPNSAYRGHYITEAFANRGPQCLDYAKAVDGSWDHLAHPRCVLQPVFAAPDRVFVAVPSQTSTGYVMRPFSGDSAAGPAAAGVAALLLSAHVPAHRIDGLLRRGARREAAGGWGARYGYGLIDADRAAVLAGVLKTSAQGASSHSGVTPALFHPSTRFLRARRWMLAARHGNAGALQRLEAGARAGDAGVQTWLAIYDHGRGKERTAARWCWQAARAGQPVAQSFLGTVFNRGWGVPMDPRAAHAWWLRAARAGVPQGLYNLGITTAIGRGARPNPELGYALMRAAAKRGFHSPQVQAALSRVGTVLNARQRRVAASLAARIAANPASNVAE